MAWTTLHLQVVTPLFSGDDPGGSALIRVPSVRGVLRFWLRAVVAGRGLVRREDLRALWEAEEGVLGSTRVPSRIGMRIRSQPETSTEKQPPWTQNSRPTRFDGAQYLLGQGLWRHGEGLIRGHVPPDATFKLDVRFSGDDVVDSRFLLALWAWLTFGGLGARTRRGFGQLRCLGVSGADLPAGWSTGQLARPTSWDGWDALARNVYPPRPPWSDPKSWTDLPTTADELPPDTVAGHPTLHRRWWSAEVVELNATDLGRALHLTGVDWRRFRAGPDAEMDEDDLPFAGTRSPEWTAVIRGSGTSYTIAALGLPVTYFSRRRESELRATVAPFQDQGELRRASPIWLRPVKLADGRWQLVTFVFFARLLPDATHLKIDSRLETDTCVKTDSRRLSPSGQASAAATWTKWLSGEPRLEPGADLGTP